MINANLIAYCAHIYIYAYIFAYLVGLNYAMTNSSDLAMPFHCISRVQCVAIRLVTGCYGQDTPARCSHLPARYLNKFCRLPADPEKRP